MKKWYFILFTCLAFIPGIKANAQNNVISIFEGERVQSVRFDYKNFPADSLQFIAWMRQVENTFLIYPFSHFNSFMTDYYLSQVKNLPFVDQAKLNITSLGEGGIDLLLTINFRTKETEQIKANNLFRNIRTFPVIYANKRSFLTFKLSGSEMIYADDNAWFAGPDQLLAGNPLADHPPGQGFTGWIEGFAMTGIYGITEIIPSWNFHLYGGTNYIVAFSAGRELFTNRSRFYGETDDAFIGIVGGKRTHNDHEYAYNVLYGRKQFILGDGWLIVNTSMNGEERGALQLNPRRAAKRLFQAGIRRDKLMLQVFQVRPNELSLLNSRTTLNGLNVEWGNNNQVQLGASIIHVPRSNLKYYTPGGHVYSRAGLWVYNLRTFGNQGLNKPGFFYKSELGYETNDHFPMKAYAGYLRLGWNFARTPGQPALSYRFAYFSGDDPATNIYERWDALYTGGTGEQWIQGSNMYKVVQNSNEMTHLLQLIYTPIPKIQTVTQFWSFIAPQKNNLGGNPGLSTLESRYYGTELNLTVKYFHSPNWYFHLNTALTFPGNAIRDTILHSRNWLCLMAFVQYSL